MTNRTFSECVIIACLLIFPFALTAQQDAIDSFINVQLKDQKIPGLSIGIIKNGKVLKSKGYGLANMELNVPATANTIYKIGSISKQFVAVGILKLEEEGKLKVSDHISKYIKNTPANWKNITIRHLIVHTSGLRVEPPNFDGNDELSDSIYITRAFSDTLLHPTGSKFEYSNFAYFILADIIRIASKKSFSQFMEQDVFSPSNMINTRTTSPNAIIPDRADGYTKNTSGSIINAPNFIQVRPGGGFLSNIPDMLKWEMTMQKHQLLAPKSWNKIFSDTTITQLTMDDQPMYYGYGWMENKMNEKLFVHHGGSMPGFKSVYFRYVEDNTAIIILTNAEYADAYAIAFGVAEKLRAYGFTLR